MRILIYEPFYVLFRWLYSTLSHSGIFILEEDLFSLNISYRKMYLLNPIILLVSIVAPAFNEAITIVHNVYFPQEYPKFEWLLMMEVQILLRNTNQKV
jgi:hypothetical protein